VAYRAASGVETRSLLGELATLSTRRNWTGTAARYLIDAVPATSVVAESPLVSALPLNDGQEQALRASATVPLTVITGPPGTGKSQLVAAIVAAAWLRDESVLVASTNNAAVDVAVQYARDIDRGLLVRTGNESFRDALPDVLEQLAARPAPEGPSAVVAHRSLDLALAERAAVHARLEHHAAVEGELAQLAFDLPLIREQIWGEQGRSPVHDARATLARRARKAANARWFAGRRGAKILRAAQVGSAHRRAVDVAEWADAELRWDALTAEAARLGPRDAGADRLALEAADDRWIEASRMAVQRVVAEALYRGADRLRGFAKLRRGATTARVAALADSLPFARGWACTALSVAANFPLTPGLFDLLVVDEASQCGIAAILPLAYRAKRLVIVGDPNQLTPVVTLSEATVKAVASSLHVDEQAMVDQRLSYRKDSAFTAFESRAVGSTYLLNEHYRCHPRIANFFNRNFYGGKLRVLSDIACADGEVCGLQLIPVRGRTELGPHGSARNRAEADAVVSWVLGHLNDSATIGVVTPFAPQAADIERRLRRELGETAWSARSIAVGTAHRLQGDQRDIVVFSAVLATDAQPGTVRWVEEQRNLINVAVSRAKRTLVVIADPDALERLEATTLQKLVAAARGDEGDLDSGSLREDAQLHSQAEQRLYAALRSSGLDPQLKVVVEGYELDFAIVFDDGTRLNVECDGTQHMDERGRQRRQDLRRDHVLGRLGWRVQRYPAWRCLSDPAGVAADILASGMPGA
jgi:very-short-patch-repair endonuclease